jgi:hypothetical protein
MPTERIPGHSTTPPTRDRSTRRVTKPHVWTTGFGLDPLPALLCSWQRTPAGAWEGYVVVAEYHAGSDDPTVRQRWVDAAKIYPHRPDLPTCAVDDHLHRA